MKNPQDMDKKMGLVQENMLKLHEQRRKIMDAKNPQEREQLMQVHRETIHQYMQATKEGRMMSGDAKNGSCSGADKQQKDGENYNIDSAMNYDHRRHKNVPGWHRPIHLTDGKTPFLSTSTWRFKR